MRATGRTPLSPSMRAACPFAEAGDYEVAFEIPRPEGRRRSAEQWARSMFEEAPLALRWFLIVGWIALTCRLRLRPRRSPTRVLGWEIESHSPDTVVLVVHAWVGITSRLVVSVDAGSVTLASFVHCTRPAARAVWAAAIPLHERVLPYLLASAGSRLRALGLDRG